MTLSRTFAAACMVAHAASAAWAQSPPPPSSPGTPSPPAWSRVLPMPDGRTFVTDGGLAIDTAIAKPAALPSTVLPAASGEIFARHLTDPHQHEIALADLRAGSRPNTFVTPSGVLLNGNYVNFLRSAAPVARVRLRVRGAREPVVIVLDGTPVGVLMPVAG